MSAEELKDGLSKEEIEEIKFAFNKYDVNKTGKIIPKTFLKEMASIKKDVMIIGMGNKIEI